MEIGKTWCSGAGVPCPSGLFFFFFFYKQVLLWVVGFGGFHDNWELGSQEIVSPLRTFTNEAKQTLFVTNEGMSYHFHIW